MIGAAPVAQLSKQVNTPVHKQGTIQETNYNTKYCKHNKHNYNSCLTMGKSLASPCKSQYLKIMWALFVHKDVESCCNKCFLVNLVIEAPLLTPVTGACSSIHIFDSGCFGYRDSFHTVLDLFYYVRNSLSISDKDV